MVKIKLKGTAGKQNSPDWYRHDTEELAGVTNLPQNKLIGLDNVLIFDPSDSQSDKGIICPIMIKTMVGDIRALVCQSKQSPETIYLRPPQSREEKDDGEIVYHNEVNLNSKVTAQVLRYMETQVDVIADEPQKDADLEGIQVGVDSNPFGSTEGKPAPVGGDDENPFAS